MFAAPKLIVVSLLIIAAWVGYRWLNGLDSRAAAPPPDAAASERSMPRIWWPAGSAAPMSQRARAPAAGPIARGRADHVTIQGAALSFQSLILDLQSFWAEQGCVILQPYDVEVGAGTFHPATALRALGPEPWRAAYVQPSRRPTDGRYGENPNRLQHYYQLQVILKPAPADSQDLYLASLAAIGIDAGLHDIRFVEDDWESPTLGAWGLGWEVWLDGMEVSQFTYFQQVGGIECDPVSTELTYGLERLAMYVQGVESVFDLDYNGAVGARPHHLRPSLQTRRAGILRLQFRVRRHCPARRSFRRCREGVPGTGRSRAGAAGL